MMNLEELAEKAYQAYGSVTEFKNFQGNPMPKWKELPEKIQLAWTEATKSVMQNILRSSLVNNNDK